MPWLKSFVAATPFLLSIAAATVIPSLVLSAVVLVSGAVAMFALFFVYVPLERR